MNLFILFLLFSLSAFAGNDCDELNYSDFLIEDLEEILHEHDDGQEVVSLFLHGAGIDDPFAAL